MFRHLKCHPQGIQCALLTLHTDFSGLSKIKLLKYKMINFNKMLIVQRNKRFAVIAACLYSHYANLLLRSKIYILLRFIVLYFNNFVLLRPKKSICNFNKAQ